MNLRLHKFLTYSRANGPGARAVIWVQGCSLGCPGCFNPETHRSDQGEVISINNLCQRIIHCGNGLEGITISGGEPLQQRAALTELLRRIRQETALSVILFSGFAWEEIVPIQTASSQASVDESPGSRAHRLTRLPGQAPELLRYLDVLIAGRYDQTQRFAHGLRGSANKTVHFLTDRYDQRDLDSVACAEVIVTADGELMMSGIDPMKW